MRYAVGKWRRRREVGVARVGTSAALAVESQNVIDVRTIGSAAATSGDKLRTATTL